MSKNIYEYIDSPSATGGLRYFFHSR